MSEEKALNVGPSGIEVTYERFGDHVAPPVLLLMGGGAQMINWPEGFCAELAGRGLQVIRFDNRDTGRSTHFSQAPVPDLQAALAGHRRHGPQPAPCPVARVRLADRRPRPARRRGLAHPLTACPLSH
ncbi:alpha/beta fold hydrolase [Planotetraspora phitsanulokensis]|nr:hypothetical protein [Planotetraspora phitsanulokensis]